MPADVNLWPSADHSLEYLQRADSIPHRGEGEAALLEFLPAQIGRVLDVGSGGGRLLALVKAARPAARCVALDFSPTMLQVLRNNFGGEAGTTVVEHDFARVLPELGSFDAVVSSFAIHHVPHERKRSLYGEIFGLLNPGGVFLNLEHVASPSLALHHKFLDALGIPPKPKIPQTNFSILRFSWLGCARSVLWTWTATGNGAS